MASRQEQAIEAAPKQAKSKNGAIPKFRQNIDWETLPVYDKLPDWALVDKSEVALLTSMSHSVIDRRVANGEFMQPKKHGKNLVWPVGYVRDWCKGVHS